MTLLIGISMTVGYGTLYYAFAILGPEVAADFDWPLSFVFGCFSAALLSSAVSASLAGRAIDRFGARPVLVIGSLCAALALAGLSLVGSKLGFLVMLVAVETAGRMVQYEAGFAALTAIHGANARRHITHVTLVAGFASTVFWPLIHWLLTMMDWRDVCLVLAAINLAIALPIHAVVPNRPTRSRSTEAEVSGNQAEASALLPIERHRSAFVLMAINFALGRFMMGAIHSAFFVLVTGTGRDAALAALAGSLIGPMQVAARFIEAASGGRALVSLIGIVSSGAMCGGIVLLLVALLGNGDWPVLLFAAVFGIGQGLAFIVKAVLPARLFGTIGYGRVTGNLAAISLVCMAAGPLVTAFLVEKAGIGFTLMVLSAVGLIAVVTAIALHRLETTASNKPYGVQAR